MFGINGEKNPNEDRPLLSILISEPEADAQQYRRLKEKLTESFLFLSVTFLDSERKLQESLGITFVFVRFCEQSPKLVIVQVINYLIYIIILPVTSIFSITGISLKPLTHTAKDIYQRKTNIYYSSSYLPKSPKSMQY